METKTVNDPGSTKGSKQLFRVRNIEYLSAAEIHEKIMDGSPFDLEQVYFEGNPVEFNLKIPKGMDLSQLTWTTEDEAMLAEALYEALSEVKKVSLGLLTDPGVWAWIGITQLTEYVINRWCGGWKSTPESIDIRKYDYFLTGFGNHKQTRCAVRRLYIAADASWRCDNNFESVHPFIEKADLYTSIFERALGVDPELAVEMVTQYRDLSRAEYRKAIKLVGLILSTASLEYLNRTEKSVIVSDAKSEMTSNLILD